MVHGIDRGGGLPAHGRRDELVDVAERHFPRQPPQVQPAQDPPVEHHRDPEQRGRRCVLGGGAHRAAVVGHPVRPNRLAGQHDPDQPERAGQVRQLRDLPDGHSLVRQRARRPSGPSSSATPYRATHNTRPRPTVLQHRLLAVLHPERHQRAQRHRKIHTVAIGGPRVDLYHQQYQPP